MIAQAPLSSRPAANRPTFSPTWVEAVRYVVSEAEACGLTKRVDAAGNIHLRSPENIGRRLWLSGSHLDSVPNGGAYDGVVGVIIPLEVFRAAREDKLRPPPLELVIFAEEEGTTFGLGMLGSRTWAGTLDAAALVKFHNSDGQDYCSAGKPFGVRSLEFASDRFRAEDYSGLVEVHVEQGPSLWKKEQPVALVTAINGRRQYRVALEGVANHAGSTGMADRFDALAGAAEMIALVEKIPGTLSPQAVATVGRIECLPNALNVIPSRVEFTIDFRAPLESVLDQGAAELDWHLPAIAQRRGLKINIETTEILPAAPLSTEVCQLLREAAARLNCTLPETASGALHDAAILSPLLPAAMLFVASRDGISHNPDEYSEIEHISQAARILYELVTTTVTREQS